ncbi:hypothetical protein IEQ34_001367 [Dendrobium chrysotoxum]|uniref:Uncharacterized protein n=1 Tax=Dendrobium chrysotoxum TaxID=161865 RepID=A0AAV7HNH7_DENCH|nr:hypothetical protein IEQ34_001367 [Dendrobium chrysotoxum]
MFFRLVVVALNEETNKCVIINCSSNFLKMAVICLVDPDFLNGKNYTHLFRYALYGISLSLNFSDLKIISYCGLSSLWILEDEILALVAPFEFALLNDEFSIIVLNSKHVLIMLVNDLDYYRVFFLSFILYE